MSDCRKIQETLSARAGRGAGGGDETDVAGHLERCPRCRRYRDDLRRIADAAFAPPRPAPAPAGRPAFLRWLLVPHPGPALAGLLAGIILGGASTYLVLHQRRPVTAAGTSIVASREFIDRVEYQMARRDTLDYLEKSQYLLVDFIQAAPGRARVLEQGPGGNAVRDLLSKKRLINAQLDSVGMAKARAICDQIETLFLELSAVSGELSDAEAARIRDYIEHKQLLLKINLLK